MKKVLLVLSKDVLPGNKLANDSIANCEGAIEHLRRNRLGLESHLYNKIILTGGIFRNFQNIPVSLIMHGFIKPKLPWLDDSAFLLEMKSKDTYQNIDMSLDLLKQIKDPTITIVAHWAHALRAKYLLWRRGASSSIVPLRYSIGLRGWCYEALAWVMTLLDSKGDGFLAKRNRAARTF